MYKMADGIKMAATFYLHHTLIHDYSFNHGLLVRIYRDSTTSFGPSKLLLNK